MAFFNRVYNKMFPPKAGNPDGNKQLGNGAVVIPNMSAEQIKQGLLEGNSLASMKSNQTLKPEAAQLEKPRQL
ncbi:MAG: hypothetical protein ACLPYS_15985 [Vulcanimicrobiaceae bacterium]|jgi:hypothetical protein